jgi:putative oxidoreductase
MKWAILGARSFLGLIYVVFGLNGFLQFLPMPPMPEQAGAMLGALVASGYFFPVLKATEVVMGALLLGGVFAPLALVILAPVTLHIFLFHFFLTPGGWGMGAFMVALHAFLGWAYLPAFKGLLNAKAAARA